MGCLVHCKYAGNWRIGTVLAHENVADKVAIPSRIQKQRNLMDVVIDSASRSMVECLVSRGGTRRRYIIAQRMLSAKDEKMPLVLPIVQCGTLRPAPLALDFDCFGFAGYIPELSDISRAFPNASAGHDLGYSAMLTYLPPGLLGLVVTSLLHLS